MNLPHCFSFCRILCPNSLLWLHH